MLRCLLLGLLGVLPLVAQAQLVESIEVRVTNLDVVVTDRSGNPVAGLTKDDFIIIEDGEEQPITNFYEIRETATAGAQLAGETVKAVSPPVPESLAKRRVVVFVDNYTIHPLVRNRAFESLERAMDELIRDGDEAMIVFWNRRLEIVAPFTTDREELARRFREAAKRSAGGMSFEQSRNRILEHAQQMIADARVPSRLRLSIRRAYDIAITSTEELAEEMYAIESEMLRNLEQMIGTLAGVEGKKALIFLGAELPQDPAIALFQQLDGMFGRHMMISRPAAFTQSGKRSLGLEMRRVAHEANANGVTMYMVDTADRDRRGDPTQGSVDPSAAFMSQTNTPIAMAMIAGITGGVAVTGAKNFDQALDAVVRDLSAYYSLGYRSPSGENGTRNVRVRVKRDGLSVRTRGSYVARSPEDEVRERVIANVFHSNVRSDFGVRLVTGVPEKQPNGRYKVPVTVHFPSTMTLIPQDGRLEGEFAVYIATGTDEGALSEVSKSTQPMRFPAGTEAELRAMEEFDYSTALLVRPGEQTVSIAVVDLVSGTAGFARQRITAQ